MGPGSARALLQTVKALCFTRPPFWPGAQPPGSFFGLTTQTIIPPERRTAYGPARLGNATEIGSTITPRGARPRGIFGEDAMTNELRKDLAVIVGMGFLAWLLSRGWPW